MQGVKATVKRIEAAPTPAWILRPEDDDFDVIEAEFEAVEVAFVVVVDGAPVLEYEKLCRTSKVPTGLEATTVTLCCPLGRPLLVIDARAQLPENGLAASGP